MGGGCELQGLVDQVCAINLLLQDCPGTDGGIWQCLKCVSCVNLGFYAQIMLFNTSKPQTDFGNML